MSRRKLSQRQLRRIAQIQERRRAKLACQGERALMEENDGQVEAGWVVVRHGTNLVIAAPGGRLCHCLIRQNIGHPVCGDRVVWQPTGSNQGVVTALLPRNSLLARPDFSGREKPLAANITRLIVVLAPQPEPTDYLVDQYLVAAEQIGVDALIVLNKTDLVANDEAQMFLQRFAPYTRLGYTVIPVSAHHGEGLDQLLEQLDDHTAILVGQSGVGKSSLIHALLPDLDVQVGRLSELTGLGRHTTSATTWYRLPAGGGLIDSPGVRSFRLGRLERVALERGFRDFRPYLKQCRFADCHHDQEPGCAIKAAVACGAIERERFVSFHHLAAQLETATFNSREVKKA